MRLKSSNLAGRHWRLRFLLATMRAMNILGLEFSEKAAQNSASYLAIYRAFGTSILVESIFGFGG